MLKVACLPSHPLEKLVARKKRRGSEAVYEALLPPLCSRSTRLVATLIQKHRPSPLQTGASPLFDFFFIRKNRALLILFRGDERQRKESGGFMIGEREGAWLVCHWVGGGTRRKGGRPAEFTSEIANMNTNEILNCV
ncbi:hypothetical protein Patl1_37453 [Pistacia atlantica]|nr:hypothetical protein Patl1_37453 [Pistacia atlantica]